MQKDTKKAFLIIALVFTVLYGIYGIYNTVIWAEEYVDDTGNWGTEGSPDISDSLTVDLEDNESIWGEILSTVGSLAGDINPINLLLQIVALVAIVVCLGIMIKTNRRAWLSLAMVLYVVEIVTAPAFLSILFSPIIICAAVWLRVKKEERAEKGQLKDGRLTRLVMNYNQGFLITFLILSVFVLYYACSMAIGAIMMLLDPPDIFIGGDGPIFIYTVISICICIAPVFMYQAVRKNSRRKAIIALAIYLIGESASVGWIGWTNLALQIISPLVATWAVGYYTARSIPAKPSEIQN